MKRTYTRLVPTVLALALVAILTASIAGCGSGEDASGMLLAAVDKTAGLQSARAAFSLQAVTGDSGTQYPLAMNGTLAVDLTTNSVDLSTSLPVVGTPIGMRMVNGALYLNLSGRWLSNPESLLGTLGLQAVGKSLPTFGELFQLMRYVSQVRKLGTESVDGVDCDHLAVKPDYSRISGDSLPEFLQTLAGGKTAANDALRNSNLTMEAWVAKDSGYLKQAIFSFTWDLPRLPLLEMGAPEHPACQQRQPLDPNPDSTGAEKFGRVHFASANEHESNRSSRLRYYPIRVATSCYY